VTVALCVAGSVRLFASASTMARGAHASSLHGSRHAKLVPPPATVRHVAGQLVTAVGDSTMVASTPALQTALPGIYIDAEVGRQFGTGLAVIADLKAKGAATQHPGVVLADWYTAVCAWRTYAPEVMA
jgi:hypothetical protein